MPIFQQGHQQRQKQINSKRKLYQYGLHVNSINDRLLDLTVLF